MKNILHLLFLLISFVNVVAQKRLPEFGKIDISELTMKECSFEKNANAMNLIRSVKISFDNVVTSRVAETTNEYRVRIKIFNEKGFSEANIKIPYFSESKSSKVKDIEAYIYNLDKNGDIIKEKLEKKEIFKEKSKAKNSLNSISFTFRNLQSGSVIEYKYTKIDKYSYSLDPWLFQDELPTAISNVTLSIPTYMGMHYHFVTFNPVEKDSLSKKYGGGFYDEDIHSFTMRNVLSFRIEPYMGSLKDNLQRVEFASFEGGSFESSEENNEYQWRHYNSILLKARFFGKQFDKPIEDINQFIDSVKLLRNNESKIATVYSYIKKMVKWNNELTFYCDSIEGCWKNKTGSSAEMNILLLNILRKVNVNCYPILASTHNNGKPDETFPSLSQFDCVDIIVPDGKNFYILDCTQKGLSFKMPPLNVLNSKAFIVDPKQANWIYIENDRINRENRTNITLNTDSIGNVSGESRVVLTGFAKSAAFAQEQKDKEDKDKNEKDLSDNAESLSIDTTFDESNDDNSDTLIQRTRFHFTPSNTGASYFLNPYIYSYFKKNPFTDTTRLYDIDFGSTQTYFISIHLKTADNFTIEDFPKKISIRMQDSSILFRREVFQENNEILIRTTFKLNDYYFTKENYPGVKSFFDKVYALINEEILLKKNN